MQTLLFRVSTLSIAFLPLFAHAQATAQSIIEAVGTILSYVVPVVFALILLATFWGIAKFVFSVSEEGKTAGKSILIWSVVALFLASSIWGIVAYLQQATGTGGIQSGDVPALPSYR